jgi:hypothetical protein
VNLVREQFAIAPMEPRTGLAVRGHAGPGSVVFSPHTEPIAETEGMATTTATFEQPGEYVIRVRADSGIVNLTLNRQAAPLMRR